MTKGEERAIILKTCKQETKMCTFTVPKKLKDMVAKVSNGATRTYSVIVAMCEYLEDKDSDIKRFKEIELKAMIEFKTAGEKELYTIRIPVQLVEEFFEYKPQKTSTEKYNEALWKYALSRSA